MQYGCRDTASSELGGVVCFFGTVEFAPTHRLVIHYIFMLSLEMLVIIDGEAERIAAGRVLLLLIPPAPSQFHFLAVLALYKAEFDYIIDSKQPRPCNLPCTLINRPILIVSCVYRETEN